MDFLWGFIVVNKQKGKNKILLQITMLVYLVYLEEIYIFIL